jgi:hypothetical protein
MVFVCSLKLLLLLDILRESDTPRLHGLCLVDKVCLLQLVADYPMRLQKRDRDSERVGLNVHLCTSPYLNSVSHLSMRAWTSPGRAHLKVLPF